MSLPFIYRVLQTLGVLTLCNKIATKWERLISDIRYDEYQSKYDIHESFLKRRNPGIEIYGEGEISTGPGSYIGRYSRVKAGEGSKITIGEGCAISHNVAIYSISWLSDQDFGARNPVDFAVLDEETADVRIGDNVWIGYNVFVNPGNEIGSNAIVGANSVVTRDIPPDSVAVGKPAKVVKFKSSVSESQKRAYAREYFETLSEDLKMSLSIKERP